MRSVYVPLPEDVRIALTELAARELRRGCYDRIARAASRARSWMKRAERRGRCPRWPGKRGRSNHRPPRRAQSSTRRRARRPRHNRHYRVTPSLGRPSATLPSPLTLSRCNPPPKRDA